jgi:hypothetical protein
MAQEVTFDSAQQRELETNLQQTLTTRGDLKEQFCKHWPSAKTVLDIILQIPRLPETVSKVIKGVIKAGDLAHETLCK